MFWVCRARLEIFLNGAELSLNSVISVHSANLINYSSMNWVPRSCLSHVSCWHCGSILDSYTRDGRFESFYCNDKYFNRPKHSCGKVMFSQACVKNSVYGGECLPQCMLGYIPLVRPRGCVSQHALRQTPQWTDNSWVDTPLGRHTWMGNVVVER